MQGSHGHGQSWNLKLSWDVMSSHEKKSWKTDIIRIFLEKSWDIAQTIQFRAYTICGYGSLLVCSFKFPTFFRGISCMHACIYNVSFVMGVAVRGGHLYFSKKF